MFDDTGGKSDFFPVATLPLLPPGILPWRRPSFPLLIAMDVLPPPNQITFSPGLH